MRHDLVVVPDLQRLAADGAHLVTAAAAAAIADHGTFRFAVSGGRTPWTMFGVLGDETGFPWQGTEIFQVDERVVAADDPDRNLTHLRGLVPDSCTVHAMPVLEKDLDHACATYAATLPDRFDLVHLGLGADGHTASLVPGDTVLQVRDRLVALTGQPYQGHRRMTLTYAALERADELLWLVSGSDKREALRRLLTDDRSIPAARVSAGHSTVLADSTAARLIVSGAATGPSRHGSGPR